MCSFGSPPRLPRGGEMGEMKGLTNNCERDSCSGLRGHPAGANWRASGWKREACGWALKDKLLSYGDAGHSGMWSQGKGSGVEKKPQGVSSPAQGEKTSRRETHPPVANLWPEKRACPPPHGFYQALTFYL